MCTYGQTDGPHHYISGLRTRVVFESEYYSSPTRVQSPRTRVRTRDSSPNFGLRLIGTRDSSPNFRLGLQGTRALNPNFRFGLLRTRASNLIFLIGLKRYSNLEYGTHALSAKLQIITAESIIINDN